MPIPVHLRDSYHPKPPPLASFFLLSPQTVVRHYFMERDGYAVSPDSMSSYWFVISHVNLMYKAKWLSSSLNALNFVRIAVVNFFSAINIHSSTTYGFQCMSSPCFRSYLYSTGIFQCSFLRKVDGRMQKTLALQFLR